GAESPLSDIDVVRAPIGHLSARIIPEETKQVVNAVLVVPPLRGGTEPHIIIQFGGRIAVRHIGRIPLFDPVRTGQADLDGFDFADGSGADILASFAETLVRALLAARLKNPFVMAHRL